LTGATRLFVKLPFIIEGIFMGLISVILVFPALMGTVKGVNYMVSNFTSLGIKLSFDTSVWIWLFTLVVVIALIGSYRAVSSFLK
jgi:cell division protein FtsX